MSARTPGPLVSSWEPRATQPDTFDLWLFGANDAPVAQVYGTSGPQAEANATLLCAAPDLLAACEAAYAVLQAVAPDARGIAHTAATWTMRDAIATARKGDT